MERTRGVGAGVTRFFLFLWQLRRVVVAIALVWYGAYQIYAGVAFSRQRTISYAEFASTMPSIGWYRITGVTLDYGKAAAHHTNRGVSGSYIPAVDASGKIRLLVVGYDDREPVYGDRRRTKTIDGTVEYGADFESSLASDVLPLTGRLVPNYRVVDEGQTPHLGLGLLLGFAGLIIGVLVALPAFANRTSRVTRPSVPS